MLVLSRKPGEDIQIGQDIIITLVEIKGNRVRLGIRAPESVNILRGELRQQLAASHTDTATELTSDEVSSLR
jgi:carbon storage regulator